MLKTYASLLKNTVRTISNWKNENRPIISLLEKYYTKEDLEEFLSTGKISKYESYQSTNQYDVLQSIKSDVEEIKNFLYLDKNIDAGELEPPKKQHSKTTLKKEDIYSKILDCSVSGFYKWKQENRPIVKFLETYFKNEEIEEFLNTSKMRKLEAIREIDDEDIQFILDNKDVIRKLKEIKGVLQ